MDSMPQPSSESSSRPSFEALRAARLAAIQALYQQEHSQSSITEIVEEFIQHRLMSNDYPTPPDEILFKNLTQKVVERSEDLVTMINAHLTSPWTYETLQPVLRIIIKAGVLELLDPVSKAPAPVIISEYIDLTQGFFNQAESRMTNAVLDSVAKVLGLKLKK